MTTKDPTYDRYKDIVSLPGADGKMPRPFRVDEDGAVLYLDKELKDVRSLGEEKPIKLAELGNQNWNGYEAMRSQGRRDGARLRDSLGRTSVKSPQATSGSAFSAPLERPSVEMMTTATNNALRAVGGKGLKPALSSGLNTEFSRIDGLPDFSQGGWKKTYSSHAAEAYEHILPGNSRLAVKVYLKDREHKGLNTVTITTPTESIDHYGSWPAYTMGLPVNSRNAAMYLADQHAARKQEK